MTRFDHIGRDSGPPFRRIIWQIAGAAAAAFVGVLVRHALTEDRHHSGQRHRHHRRQEPQPADHDHREVRRHRVGTVRHHGRLAELESERQR